MNVFGRRCVMSLCLRGLCFSSMVSSKSARFFKKELNVPNDGSSLMWLRSCSHSRLEVGSSLLRTSSVMSVSQCSVGSLSFFKALRILLTVSMTFLNELEVSR